MARWAEFAAEAPELAEAGRALLQQFGVGLAFLATVRPDGGPRLHPVCAILHEGGLYVLVVDSPKQRDLLRDGRHALHSFPSPRADDEFYATGRARPVDDPELVAAVRAAQRAAGGESTGDERCFELDLERCLHARYKPRGEPDNWPPVYTRWAEHGDAASRTEEPELRVLDSASAADLRLLEERIGAFNADATGRRDGRLLALFLRDEAGRLRAGLSGHTWGGCAEVRYLWVRAEERRRGLGSRILAATEREAAALGCHQPARDGPARAAGPAPAVPRAGRRSVIEVAERVAIRADLERVWRALGDPAEVVRWDTGVVAPLDAPPDYPRPGQHVRWRYRLGPLRLVLHDRPVEVRPPERLRSRIRLGGFDFDETYDLAASGSGVVLSARLGVSSPVPLVGPLLAAVLGAPLARAIVRSSLAAIRRHCEARPGAGGGLGYPGRP
jgi:GNAT superfamily N-acetyltransferase